MPKYGLPYMGSKNRIARDIIDILPPGERLVDLFGGGGAITHAGSFSGKYKSIEYNDADEVTVHYFALAVYGGKGLEPRWISREEFEDLKHFDPIAAFIFSFGNNPLKGYLYSEKIEPQKKKIFDFIVKGEGAEYLPGVEDYVTAPLKEWNERRLQLKRYFREEGKNYFDRLTVKLLERCEPLERLQYLAEFNHGFTYILINNFDYRHYTYRPGDIVYCDPPYLDSQRYTANYTRFRHDEFFDWAYSADFPVFFSSREIPDSRFKICMQTALPCLLNAHDNTTKKNEFLYCNAKGWELLGGVEHGKGRKEKSGY